MQLDLNKNAELLFTKATFTQPNSIPTISMGYYNIYTGINTIICYIAFILLIIKISLRATLPVIKHLNLVIPQLIKFNVSKLISSFFILYHSFLICCLLLNYTLSHSDVNFTVIINVTLHKENILLGLI